MQPPFQVPPVPKLDLILLSSLNRIFEFKLVGKPTIVVTVFPPLPLFSLRISKRSPLPTLSFSFAILRLSFFSETSRSASGKPLESRPEKAESPKFSPAVTGRFPSSLNLFRLILRTLLFRVLRPPATTKLFHSFCFQENASVSDANLILRPSRFHPSAQAVSQSPGIASRGAVIVLKHFLISSI